MNDNSLEYYNLYCVLEEDMKNMDGSNPFKNMSATVFGHRINDVLTKIGQGVDILTENEEEKTGEKIGRVLDSMTDGVNISIGNKKKQ